MVQANIHRPNIPSPSNALLAPAGIHEAAQVQTHFIVPKKQLIADRHQWRSLTAQVHIGLSKIVDDRKTRFIGQGLTVPDLHRFPLIGPMVHGVSVTPDDVHGLPLQEALDLRGHPLGIKHIQLPELVLRKEVTVAEDAAPIGRVGDGLGTEDAVVPRGHRAVRR